MKLDCKKFAFSLAEMLVCLAIISVIAAIMMPTLNHVKPNKEKAMFKKVYLQTERVIYELINDVELYPDIDDHVGFDNTTRVMFNGVEFGDKKDVDYNVDFDPNSVEFPEGMESDEDKAKYIEEQREIARQKAEAEAKQKATDKMNKKFCQLFSLKLNTLSPNPYCGADASKISFETTDGVYWIMPYTNFMPTENFFPIYVDVNGEKEPNNMDNIASNNPNDCEDDVDRFMILVRADGEMQVQGACAVKYISERNINHNND